MTQRIELFLEVCLKELNSFWKYASKNWTLLWTWLKDFFGKNCDSKNRNFFSMTLELNFFQQTTQSTDFFQKYDSQNCNFCLRNYDSKNWTFLKIWLTDLNFFLLDSKNWTFFSWTQRIEHFFDLTQKIEPFLFLSKYNSENWICFYTTQKKLNFFQYDSLNWTFFFFENDENFFFEYNQRIGLLFLEYDARNWTPYFLNMTQRIEIIFEWLKELNFFIWLKEWNLFFFWIWLIELNFLINKTMTQRNEPFFLTLTELNPFSLNMTKELDSFFLNMTQRIEPFISWVWRNDLNS